ncbi:DsbA family oxidoreductase [Actinoplanes derwentensis]|uniref:Predicted dithiol-disulfide isomerase, DsbA family n=1 Tax=Actinoplanes derwentensis TaxID=113562 RepID=A0A1H2CTA1_9ACTN|nr:DsbA family oxidoreductase [Actinoplanes derwentensis]GID90152.1 DSBA oxidoreductase [Actinoplanes derwentensis]SDT73584.1 Predicted dithiol-disulfide isomerase, DsbA family [Actinoplanes derwentensis]
MDIQVWSDVICPWCYIGKRRLERALESFGGTVTVTYRAYQLDTSPVHQPLPIKEAMAAKFGGAARADEMFAQVTAIGAGEGLALDFDRAIAANTLAAHRLIAWAATHGRQTDMLDALQRAHFTDGVDLGSLPVLATVAESIGLPAAEALAYLESEAGTNAVRTDIEEARALGISSVPTFVIDGKYALSGAQESTTLLSALEEIVRREDAHAGQ